MGGLLLSSRATGIIMPDDVAAEKSQILEKLGAQVIKGGSSVQTMPTTV